MTSSRLTRAALGVAGALAASAALALPAQAASLVVPTDCPAAELTQPFAEWGDGNNYKLIDGGSFAAESEAWRLTGGATLRDGRLFLPAGSTATSAPVCVGHAEPTLRFFGAGTGLAPALAVSVQFQLALTGTWVTLPVGVDTGAAWRPSPIVHIVANFLPAPGEYTNVRFVFAPLLSHWEIDDVYVDPWNRA